ncbi:diguanylate cyclase [Desulfobotulus sp. H1]|uniref:diguanylate cyclase n=1 Tax=Desulfobotulus pelophilus TaxID=2823377 RepID=A0ABT3N7M0_9BACT|nr:diguanylate cyclase [Desulfobotulus pelophilus]MCW7753458.1 diguanylate cyclase [Desulfobotulus pelophilus]
MRTINFIYKDKQDLLRQSKQISSCTGENILIQVFSGVLSQSYLSLLLRDIREVFPGSAVLGTSSSGEILDGRIVNGRVVVSISFFEHTIVRSAMVSQNDNLEMAGEEIAAMIGRQDARAMIVFACGIKDGMFINGTPLLRALKIFFADTVIAGAHAGDNEKGIETFVFTEKGVSSQGVAAVAFFSEKLRVHTGINRNWVPIGKKFTVTGARQNIVYSIDDQSPYELYRHYLGNEIAKNLPLSAVNFPLMVEREGLGITVSPVSICSKNGSFRFVHDFFTGEQLRFSFCHAGLLRQGSVKIRNELKSFGPQSVFIYSCVARKRVLGGAASAELSMLQGFPASAGFFSYGEYYSADGNQVDFFTQTMTTLSLSEGVGETGTGIADDPGNKNISIEFQNLEFLHKLVETITGELETTNRELAHLARKDPVTGLYNRRFCDKFLQDEISRQSRVHGIITILLLDIDHFKLFNDRYGHVAGDGCLRAVSKKIMEAAKRPGDIPCRFGGEEFLCILSMTDHEGGKKIAEEIMRNVTALAIPHCDSPTSEYVSVSIGVLTMRCQKDMSGPAMIERCDRLLYEAKEKGRNMMVAEDVS